MENILYLKEELDSIHADNYEALREAFKERWFDYLRRSHTYYEFMTNGKNLIYEAEHYFDDYVVDTEICNAFNYVVNDMPEGFMDRLHIQIKRSLNYVDRPVFNSTNALGNLIDLWKQKGHKEFLYNAFKIIEEFNVETKK